MNRIIILSICFIIGVVACYEDKGNYDYHSINEVSISNIENEYVREKWQNLSISPKLDFLIEETDNMAYRWEFDGKLVSEERDLSYDVDLNVADDAYKCRFTAIHLEDSSRYYCDFSLRVVTPYDKGLMVLSEQEGKAMLSFLADNEEGDNFDKWVYYKENGDYLEGAPLSLEQPDYAYNSELFVTTSEGVYRLDKNILKLLKLYNGETMLVKQSDFSIKSCSFMDITAWEPWGAVIDSKGVPYIFRERNDYWASPSPNPIPVYDDTDVLINYELDEQFILTVIGYGSTGRFLGYDNLEGRFLYFRKQSSPDPEQFNRVTIRTPIIGIPALAIGMFAYEEYASFFYDPETGVAKVVPTHDATFSNVKEENVITLENHDFTPKTILRFCDATERAIYSSGSTIRQIRMRNVAGGSTLLSDKLPTDAEITCLKLSVDKKRLYVGVSLDNEDEFKGNLYVLDAVSGNIINTYSAVGGKIVDVIEKF